MPSQLQERLVTDLVRSTDHGFAQEEQHPGVEGSGHSGKVLSESEVVDRRQVVLLLSVDALKTVRPRLSYSC